MRRKAFMISKSGDLFAKYLVMAIAASKSRF